VSLIDYDDCCCEKDFVVGGKPAAPGLVLSSNKGRLEETVLRLSQLLTC
jgi:hypothetical protein